MTYIERDALLALIRPIELGDDKAAVLISDAKMIFRNAIMKAPAADVEPVVRCKDCKWYNNRMCYHPKYDYVCDIPPTMFDFDFCRYGEKRED